MKKLYVAPEMEQNFVEKDILNSASTMGTFIEDIWGENKSL